MRYERFIAGRYAGSKRQMRFIRIISFVSIIGITVGVAALLIVLSVFNGFNGVVTQVLIGFDPHVRIEPANGKAMDLQNELAKTLNNDGRIHAWAPFISSKALLMTPHSGKVVYVRGVVDSTIDKVAGVKQSLVFGKLALQQTDGIPGMVLGLALADRLAATVGSEVTVVSPAGIDAMLIQFGQPITKQFRVVGIYDSRNKDYDAHYAFVSIADGAALFQFRGQISGIEMRLNNIRDAENIQGSLRSILGKEYGVSTWYDLHQDLYSVMLIERWSAYIILCLIIGVASFNVLGSLAMGVIEKRRDIGVLKALGATNAGIVRIFMFEGIQIGIVGTLLGTILGLIVCYIQIHYQVFPLDPRVYIIPAIPVEIRWSDFISVSVASMALSSLAALYPAVRAARLSPVDSIRWE